MKYYELSESATSYFLTLNGATVRSWNKAKFSKQEAEEKASDEVSKAIKKFGTRNVQYDGCLLVA